MKTSLLAGASLAALLSACVGSVDGDQLDPPGDRDDPGDGDDDGDGECASVEVQLTDVIPTVMLLVDRSESMYQAYGNTDRWNAVYDALVANSSGVVTRMEQDVRFGVAFYTSDDGDAGPACPIMEEVLPAMGNYVSIRDMFEALDPVEDTPTAPSITATKQRLLGVTESGPKIILLATDGLPDTCAVPDPETTEAQADSVAAAMDAHTAGVDTYIVSVGPDVTQQHLQDMANAGVGLPVGGTENAPYYQALDTQGLVAAFDTIIGEVRSCSFAIDGQVDLGHASNGTVTLDGQTLEYGTEWELSDESTLELLGDACSTVMNGDHEITASFTCGSVVD